MCFKDLFKQRLYIPHAVTFIFRRSDWDGASRKATLSTKRGGYRSKIYPESAISHDRFCGIEWGLALAYLERKSGNVFASQKPGAEKKCIFSDKQRDVEKGGHYSPDGI